MTAANGTRPSTAAARKAMFGPSLGTPFSIDDRLFASFQGGTVFEYSDLDAIDIRRMLAKDGQARSLEQVLTLPLRAADWEIVDNLLADDHIVQGPDASSATPTKLCQDVLGEKLDLVIDQMTTAISFRRSFFEIDWALDGGKVTVDAVNWRPATGCDAGFDPQTGKLKGFRQRAVPVSGQAPPATMPGDTPGYYMIPSSRSFIYTHGANRDPIKGISDLDVCLWAHTTKQKVLFLLFQFLESQSLPKVVVYGDDLTQAQERADDLAELKSSGVLGLPRAGDPTAKSFEVLESGGKGAQQFLDAIHYLDSQMTSSVLATFTDLPASAARGASGSYALSTNQSEFFLSSRQAVADEMAGAIRDGLFTPLVEYNFGPGTPVPYLEIGPLSRYHTERALNLLTAVVASPKLNIPVEFVDMLTQSMASYLGLDPAAVAETLKEEAARRDKLQAQTDAMTAKTDAMQTAQADLVIAQDANPAVAAGGPLAANSAAQASNRVATAPPKPPPSGLPRKAVGMSNQVDVAFELVSDVIDGATPTDALNRVGGR